MSQQTAAASPGSVLADIVRYVRTRLDAAMTLHATPTKQQVRWIMS